MKRRKTRNKYAKGSEAETKPRTENPKPVNKKDVADALAFMGFVQMASGGGYNKEENK